MRLAVFLDDPVWFDGHDYTADATFINFVLSFGECVEELILFAPVSRNIERKGFFKVEIEKRVRLVELPFFSNTSEMYLSLPRIIPQTLRIHKRERDSWDVAWVVASHLPDLFYEWIARRSGKKTFLYIRGNIVKDIQSHRFAGIRAVSAKLLAWVTHKLVARAIKNHVPTFVVGNELFDIYKDNSACLFKVYESLITRDDIVIKRSVNKQEFVIISVGRLTPEKGLNVLVEAMALLIHREGLNIKCKLVGGGKSEWEIKEMVVKKGLESYFEFRGFVAPGKELFMHYDTADIYVLSSLTEGIPKTLYEAMARGLPVVATKVGGVSELVDDGENGFLVSPDDPDALAGAIKKLFSSFELRERLSLSGLRKVMSYTIERARDGMLETIKREILNK